MTVKQQRARNIALDNVLLCERALIHAIHERDSSSSRKRHGLHDPQVEIVICAASPVMKCLGKELELLRQ